MDAIKPGVCVVYETDNVFVFCSYDASERAKRSAKELAAVLLEKRGRNAEEMITMIQSTFNERVSYSIFSRTKKKVFSTPSGLSTFSLFISVRVFYHGREVLYKLSRHRLSLFLQIQILLSIMTRTMFTYPVLFRK
jgi:hypothetical protein